MQTPFEKPEPQKKEKKKTQDRNVDECIRAEQLRGRTCVLCDESYGFLSDSLPSAFASQGIECQPRLKHGKDGKEVRQKVR
jgi:hypothetical protein